MIKSITAINSLNESLKMILGNPEQSGFSVISIDGLGPGKADIAMKDMATIDGSVFNSARLPKRNIVLTLEFFDIPESITGLDTIEKIRVLSYKYFPIKEPITLIIESDIRTAQVLCYVESNDPDIFSGKEQTIISLICPNPYFYSLDTTVTLFSGIVAGFQFPFSNESLVSRLLSFGEISSTDYISVYYNGDSEIGIVISIHAIGPVTNPIIYNTRTLQGMTIDTTKLATMTGSAIIAGDDITITTLKGSKSITLLRAGVIYNILNTIDQNASWPSLRFGDNLFRYDALTGKVNLQIGIENQIAYQGM